MIDWTKVKADGLTRCILESPFAAPKALRDALIRAREVHAQVPDGIEFSTPRALANKGVIELQVAVRAAEEKHLRYLKALAHYALANGFAPLASQALYTQWLDDNDPAQRTLGIKAGFAWAEGVEVVLVGCDLGVSTGMELGIGFHRVAKRDVRMVHLGSQWGRSNAPSYARDLAFGRRASDRPAPAPADDTERGHLPDFGTNGERP